MYLSICTLFWVLLILYLYTTAKGREKIKVQFVNMKWIAWNEVQIMQKTQFDAYLDQNKTVLAGQSFLRLADDYGAV